MSFLFIAVTLSDPLELANKFLSIHVLSWVTLVWIFPYVKRAFPRTKIHSIYIYTRAKERGHNKHDGMTIQSILINGHSYSVRKLTGIKNCFLSACMPFIHDDNTRDENYNCKKSYKLTGKTTVKHLFFAWPYFRETMPLDRFARLYIRVLSKLLIKCIHYKLFARTLFSRL